MEKIEEEKRTKKSNKGITLIALVITIIVLLILAGVSIAMLTGPNGLLTQADEARTSTNRTGAREKVQLEVAGSYGTDGNIDLDKLNQNLLNISDIKKYKDGISTKLTNENPIEELPVDVVVDGYIFEISKEGVVTQKNGDISEPTIPTEVLAESIQVEDLIMEDGIKAKKLKVTTTPSEITENLIYTPKNTEVITVDAEGNVIAKEEGEAKVEVQGEKSGVKGECTVTVQFGVGVKVTGENKPYTKNGTAVIPVGFAIVPGCDNVSEGLVISDKENDTGDGGNQFVWIPVEGNYERNLAYANGLTLENDTDYLPEGITSESENVTKAKGFYISRYEAGKESTNILVSKKGANVWNNIAQNKEKAEENQPNCKDVAKTFSGSNENVKSGLCTGIQWDMAMAFVDGKKDGKGNDYIVTQASNDEATSDRHTGSKATSGQNEADRVCNIYDLEGNCNEYVAEKNAYDNGTPYVVRGGYYLGLSASNRYCYYGNAHDDYSFRFVLYIM